MRLINSFRKKSTFITEWTVSASDTITLPLDSGYNYGFDVDWGDGTPIGKVGSFNDPQATHTYTSAGSYEVKITGRCENFYVNNDSAIDTKITKVLQWGDVKFSRVQFYGCTNLVVEATDIPNLENVDSLQYLFRDCNSLSNIPNVESWDVSTITSMFGTFQNTDFNQDISSWDVSNVNSFRSMFSGASLFNQNIGAWDTSSATSMLGMFNGASVFNSYIGDWDVSGVSSMQDMFRAAVVYNQPLTNWVTSSLTNVAAMFFQAFDFDQPLAHFDISGISSFTSFLSNTSFNQPLNTWDVSGITSFFSMFSNSNFNQSLSTWETASATSMSGMFSGTPFNQPLTTVGNVWNVSNVSNFSTMFNGTTAFNQDLSSWNIKTTGSVDMGGMFRDSVFTDSSINSWDVSAVTLFDEMFEGSDYNSSLASWTINTSGTNVNMSRMFRNSLFNQDISGWDVSEVNNLSLFGDGTAINTTNYDLILENWSLLTLRSNVTFELDEVYTETQVDSGTTDSTTANKLIESGQNFLTTVSIGDIVHNTTDDTFAEVTAVDSDTQLSLDNDIMVSGENYVIQSSNAAKGRYVLINTYNWTITDSGAV